MPTAATALTLLLTASAAGKLKHALMGTDHPMFGKTKP